MQIKWRTEFLRDITGSGQLRDAGSFRSLIREVLFQVAECAQKCEKALVILFGQTFIQGAPVDTLRQQFRHMPARIVDYLPLLDRCSTKSLLTRHQGIPVGVHEYFERDAEFFAVTENRFMN